METKTCKNCGKSVVRLFDGLCGLCSYNAAHPQGEPKPRESFCYTTSGRYQAGEFAIIGASVRTQKVLRTLKGSTWVRGDEEHAAGDYASWYEPTTEEQQSAEYQQLAAQLAADQAEEIEATKRAQRNSEDREQWDAFFGEDEPTGHALTTPEPERHEETNAQPEPEQIEVATQEAIESIRRSELEYRRVVEEAPETVEQTEDAWIETQTGYMSRQTFSSKSAAVLAAVNLSVPSDALQDEGGWHIFSRWNPATPRNRGGARPGAGRKPDSAKAHTREPLYQEGYNAGYQAGLRKFASEYGRKLADGRMVIPDLMMPNEIYFRVFEDTKAVGEAIFRMDDGHWLRTSAAENVGPAIRAEIAALFWLRNAVEYDK